MAAEKVLFDTTKDGRNVSEFVITRPNGESFSVIEYGAAIHTLKVFDKEGKIDDVMLGFDKIADYQASGSGHGSIIGRTANRIKGGAFTIDGVDYQLLRMKVRTTFTAVRATSRTVSGQVRSSPVMRRRLLSPI